MQITIDTTTEPRASAIDAVKFLRYFFNITASEMGDVVNETVTTLKAPQKSDATIIAEEATLHIVKKAIEKLVAGQVIKTPPFAGVDLKFTPGSNPESPQPVDLDPAAVFGAVPFPQPAPSIAAAIPLPIAPVAPQVGQAMPPVATSLPAAPPVPTATAPTNPVVPTMHASGVEIDAEGLPYDPRIHASTKNKTVKGVWKARKGLNDEGFVNRVKAELKAFMALPIGPHGGVLVAANQPASDAGPPAMPTPPPPMPPAPAPTGTPTTMLELMPRVTSAVLANKLPQNALLDAVVAVGMPSIPSLQQRPDMVPEVWNRLNALYPGVLV